ncbi:MAG: hypothetical protein ACFE0J_23570 [Elainellaceae cyanobacterium]
MAEAVAFSVPDDVTFEQAIALTQTLMQQMDAGTLSDAQIQEAIASLVHTQNGARGFFVTYLTDDRSFADQPSNGVVQGLQSSPDTVAELLVKNVAMSTAMAIAHRRNNNDDMAQGSDRVRSRTVHLIETLKIPHLSELAQQLHESAATGTGEYQAFLDKWGYDAEQRAKIAEVVKGAIDAF